MLRFSQSLALSLLLAWLTPAAVAQNIHSLWLGHTNTWTSAADWQHSAPSALGYPANGVQNYDVELGAGRVTSGQPISIDRLTLSGGELVLQSSLTVQSNLLWTGGNITGNSDLITRGGVQMVGAAVRSLPPQMITYGNSLAEELSATGPNGQWWNWGSLELRGSTSLSNMVLRNRVVLTKTGSGETHLGGWGAFQSHGIVHVQEGTMRVQSQFESLIGGRIQIDAGAALVFRTSCYSESNAVVSGPGLLRLDSAEGQNSVARFGGGDRGLVVMSNLTVQLTNQAFLGNFYYMAPPGSGALVIGPDVLVSVTSSNVPSFGMPPLGIIGTRTTNYGSIRMQVSGHALAAFHNHGEFEVLGNFSAHVSGLKNRGVIRKTGAEVVRFRPDYGTGEALENSGLIEVEFGTLHLGRAGTNSGLFRAHAHATNVVGEMWSHGNFVLLDGTRFVGSGQHEAAFAAVMGTVTNESQLFAHFIREGSHGTLWNATEGTLRLGYTYCRVVNEGLVVSDTDGAVVSNVWNVGMLALHRGDLRGVIQNHGELLKVSTNLAVLSGALVNSNVLRLEQGTLALAGAVTNRGRVLGAGTLSVTNQGLVVVDVAGTNHAATRLDGGTLLLPDDLTIAGSLLVSRPKQFIGNSAITGPGDLIVASNGLADVQGGNIYGPGFWRVQAGGTLTVSTDLFPPGHVFSRSVVNEGTMQLAGQVNASGATLLNHSRVLASGTLHATGTPAIVVNHGQWIVPSNQVFQFAENDVRFTNSGRLTLQGGLQIGPIVPYTPVTIRGVGEIFFQGGSVHNNDHVFPSGSTVLGYGSNNVSFTCFGKLAPLGTLRVGNLALGTGARLQFTLGGTNAGQDYSQLICNSLFLSNGVTIDVRLTNGFMPAVGDTFEVSKHDLRPLTGPDGFGIVPVFSGLNLPNGLRLAPMLTNTRLVFVTVPAPLPGTAPLTIQRGPSRSLVLHVAPEFLGFTIQYTTNLNDPWRPWRLGTTQPMFVGGSPHRFYRMVDSSVDE